MRSRFEGNDEVSSWGWRLRSPGMRLAVLVLVATITLGALVDWRGSGVGQHPGQGAGNTIRVNDGFIRSPHTDQVEVTLPVDDRRGNPDYIARGDYIDILATVDTKLLSSKNPRIVTLDVFDMVYVIGRTWDTSGKAKTITVSMSLCDAQYLDWLRRNASLRFTLVSPELYGGPAPCLPAVGPHGVDPAAVDARWKFLGSA